MIPARVGRCLRLFYMLHRGHSLTVPGLADLMGVSKRTIFRDLRLLGEAGIPLRYDAAVGTHVIVPHFRLRPAHTSDEELIALLTAAHASLSVLPRRFGRLVAQAIGKLFAQASTGVQTEAAELMTSCIIEPMGPLRLSGREEVWQTVLAGVRERRRVRITYQHPHDSGKLSQTAVAPYRLIASSAGWIVVGRSSWHREVRSLNLEHIQRAELTDDSYTLPLKYRHVVPTSELLRLGAH